MNQEFYDNYINQISTMREEAIGNLIARYPELEGAIAWIKNTYHLEMECENAMHKENIRLLKIQLLQEKIDAINECQDILQSQHKQF
jgi:hypothetical protein